MTERDIGGPGPHRDRYRLTPSSPFTLEVGQEVRQDLTLRPPPPHPAVIFGILSPRAARSRAIVKLLTGSGAPVDHVGPDRVTGIYLFDSVQPGSYRLAAASPGFETFLGRRFQVRPEAVVRRDIRLTRAQHAQGATLGGRVVTRPGHPLADAGVALVPVRSRTPGGTHVTMSIGDGEYLICGIRPGTYMILAWKVGFTPHRERLRLGHGEHAQLDIVLRRPD